MPRILAIVGLVALVVEMALDAPEVVAAPDPQPPPGGSVVIPAQPLIGLHAEQVASGLGPLTDVVGAPEDDRIFVVEKEGRVRIIQDGVLLERPFLDLAHWVESTGNEQGLLSIRFHPDFGVNGRVFLFFTDRDADSRLVEVRVDATDRNRVDPTSIRPILEVPQGDEYHQSGSMVFGPDGMLWVSIGDGGGIGDPHRNGQNPANLYATIIRIDVDGPRPYGIPADNPFVSSSGGERPEVWAYGVRNPWRIGIDPVSSQVIVPDVGQEGSEEINVVPIHPGGHNFGWSVMEGTLCFRDQDCDRTGITPPVFEYLHEGYGCAIVGGPVYRGEAMPELHGHIFFADYCLGWIRSILVEDGTIVKRDDWEPDLGRLGNVSTIGTDRHGELYVVNLAGQVWKLVPVRQGRS